MLSSLIQPRTCKRKLNHSTPKSCQLHKCLLSNSISSPPWHPSLRKAARVSGALPLPLPTYVGSISHQQARLLTSNRWMRAWSTYWTGSTVFTLASLLANHIRLLRQQLARPSMPKSQRRFPQHHRKRQRGCPPLLSASRRQSVSATTPPAPTAGDGR